MKLRKRRIYDPPGEDEGLRVLVDRLWPRGISKERAGIDLWVRELAPSDELRRWYGHEPSKWDEFRDRYFAELDGRAEAVDGLRRRIGEGRATLLFSSRETELNNAAALAEYLARGSD